LNRHRIVAVNEIRKVLLFCIVAAVPAAIVACADTPPISPPEQLPGSPFHYPEELWDAGVEGETVLEIHVSAAGTVDSARVSRTSGYAEFDSAAVEGARELRFEPARRGDEPLPVQVLLPVQFQLPEPEPGDEPPEAGEP
jgi:periplasmic protein TonB